MTEFKQPCPSQTVPVTGTALPSTPTCQSNYFWTVKAGDTFYTIANQINIPVSKLLQLNPGVDPYTLQIGQKICLPYAPTAPPCQSNNFWTVKAGDSIYLIAQQSNTTVAKLLVLNPLVNLYNLQVGQKICLPFLPTLPPTAPPCQSKLFWLVETGDTIYLIAQQSNTTVTRLFELNPHVDPNNLQVGQRICLP